jgi:cytochrome P450
LSDGELVWLIRELLVAGNETTTKLLTDLVRRLADRPQEWARIRTDPDRAALVVDESLRLAAPVQGMFRRVTRPTVLGGVALAQDTTVFVAFGSANRDAAVFPAPDRFDPERPSVRQHLSFGQGIHAWLGNMLARMEATIAVKRLAEAADDVSVVDPSAVHYTQSFMLRGIPEPVVTRRAS